MKKQDAELIKRVLDGDQSAFTAIVDKYQKGIHTLAWQKTGDFHLAQEITQDTFLMAYQKLGTLKNRKLFCGWLYVIATNMCNDWLRKKRLPVQSLETVDTKEVDRVAYTNYIDEQIEEDANESRRELVKNLLKKLPESERTVMSLHYLGEMTCESISEFLGVSQNTIKSRLSRARHRLKKEEAMIRENLSSFQLPTQFTENIMDKIMNIKPITPSVTKPLIPLAISAATAILAVLLIGVGAQHILSFQKPFNLDALSEQNVEITEVQLVLDSPTKHTLQSQIGNPDVSNENNGIGQNSDAALSNENEPEINDNTNVKGIRIHAKALEGGPVPTLFATTGGDLFAGTLTGLYRLSDDGSKWQLITTRNAPPLNEENRNIGWGVMAERNDTLYIATDAEILSSTDRGETWKTIGTHPGGMPTGFVKTKNAFYLGLSDKIYYSDDRGVDNTTWRLWSIEDTGKKTGLKINAIKSIKDTVFVGTDEGLYRFIDDGWVQLQVEDNATDQKGNHIADLAVAGDNLFVAVIEHDNTTRRRVSIPQGVTKSVPEFGWELYLSIDKGNTWKLVAVKEDVFEPNRMYFPFQVFGPRRHQFPYTVMGPNFNVKINATKGRIALVDTKYQSYSLNHDGNWNLDDTANFPFVDKSTPSPMFLNPNVIYKSHRFGILRSLDGGKTWGRFNHGIYGTTIWEIYAFDDTLYAYTPNGIIVSNDGGESWKNVLLFAGDKTVTLNKSGQHLYARTDRMVNLVADPAKLNEDNRFNVGDVIEKVGSMKILRIQPSNNGKTLTRETPTYLPRTLPNFEKLPGNFTVTGTTFYAETDNNLYRWKHGDSNWYNTKLIDENNKENLTEVPGWKIAVSDKTVYVGKRSGHLMLSLDEGETWTDVTSNLPFTVQDFKAVVFVHKDVYVATDKGVIRSTDGKAWVTLTNKNAFPLVMNRLAVADTTVYGESGQVIYSINIKNDKWKQVTPEITYPIACFDADGSKVYVGTYGSGLLLYELDE